MVKLTIDGIEVKVPSGTTILEAAKKIRIEIPTLCFLKDINEVGACRVCVVEVEGQERLQASCNTPCEDGMVVYTNSERVLEARKNTVKLILAQHNLDCENCKRDGNCQLQKISVDLGVYPDGFKGKALKKNWNESSPLIRDASKCIQCLRCINVCEKVQSLGVWELTGTGQKTRIGVRNGIDFSKINCSLCGQCITHCPVGALTERDDTELVEACIEDKNIKTVFQIAPAVRAAFFEAAGIDKKKGTSGRMVAAVKKLGADFVFDTDFSADLTIMEEGSELVHRIGKVGTALEAQKAGKPFVPMFTSCCPGWVRFMKLEYPEMVKYLSTSKSPQQMFGSVAKTYFSQKSGIPTDQIRCISIMPCVAKKYELRVADSSVDLSITTRELGRLLNKKGINVAKLKEEEFDSPLGTATGAGVIFGATGGVMEAALRSAYFLVTGKNPDAEAFKEVRADGMDHPLEKCWRDAEFMLGDKKLLIAVASGLKNARALVQAIKAGQVYYDFVEIMACPGGCAGGGGQPIREGFEMAFERGKELYRLDKDCKLRFSHENPAVQKLYSEYLKQPLSEKAEELLHTNQDHWEL